MSKSIFIGAQVVWAALVVWFLVSWFRGQKLPFVANERAAFIALGVIGFLMCSFGLLSQANALNWLNPYMIFASLLGAAALYMLVALPLGWKVPFVTNYQTGLLLLAAIIVVKFVSTTMHRLL